MIKGSDTARKRPGPASAGTPRFSGFTRIELLVVIAVMAILLCSAWLAPARLLAAEADVCAVCGRPIIDNYYGIEDEVTLEKMHVCAACEHNFPDCFLCGLPADTNVLGFVRLPDQRVLCARDARTAVLRQEDGLRICNEVHDQLDRLFSRFTSFPETNVTVQVMDRVDLQKLFKLPGNDCPNVWGLTQTETNQHRIYRLSLMTGLPLRWFQATCAHEYGHTWVGEQVPEARKQLLDRDAEEGFCEMVSFLLMDSLNDEAQKARILRNAYTRGRWICLWRPNTLTASTMCSIGCSSVWTLGSAQPSPSASGRSPPDRAGLSP